LGWRRIDRVQSFVAFGLRPRRRSLMRSVASRLCWRKTCALRTALTPHGDLDLHADARDFGAGMPLDRLARHATAMMFTVTGGSFAVNKPRRTLAVCSRPKAID